MGDLERSLMDRPCAKTATVFMKEQGWLAGLEPPIRRIFIKKTCTPELEKSTCGFSWNYYARFSSFRRSIDWNPPLIWSAWYRVVVTRENLNSKEWSQPFGAEETLLHQVLVCGMHVATLLLASGQAGNGLIFRKILLLVKRQLSSLAVQTYDLSEKELVCRSCTAANHW